ncbi:MAG: sulfatase-like hydrolase/transferase [Phycisphaeraceae bacterium]
MTAAPPRQPASRRPRRPNILVILSDQQRWDTLGCYGQRLPISPHLDELASDGVRFNHAFTMQPVCGPARSCLQSGLYATETGCITNNIALPPDQPTIARALTDAGYDTAYVGKWHLAADADNNYRTRAIPPERRGGWDGYWRAADTYEFTSSGYEGYVFDEAGNRIDWEGYRVDKTTDFALDYLRDYATRRPTDDAGRDKPFVMFLSYLDPHHQNDLNRYIGPIGSKQRFADYDTPVDLAAFDSTGSPGPDWRQHYPDYLGACWSIDQNVGRLREALKLHGLEDDTLIIYTSDHGCHFRTRNGEYKRSCHESSLRVPLILHGPGFRGGRVVDELVSLIDLPATVVSAGGASLPRVAGRPLQPLAVGDARDWPDDVFVQISESQVGRAIRTHRWKYAVADPDASRDQPGSARYVEQHLYDLDADPAELDNRVADPALADVRAELAARLKRRMAEAGEPEPTIVSAT